MITKHIEDLHIAQDHQIPLYEWNVERRIEGKEFTIAFSDICSHPHNRKHVQ